MGIFSKGSEQHRYLSRPVDVYFAGWKSSTDVLRNHGWRLAEFEDQAVLGIRFMFEHKHLRLVAFCDKYDLPMSHQQWQDPIERGPFPPLQINQVVHRTDQVVHIQGSVQTRWLDTEPEMTMEPVKSLSDLSIFKIEEAELPTVYVEQADMKVVDHLQAILDSQKGKQSELRKKHNDYSKATTTKIMQQIIKVEA
jgi:hypothetical protein